MHTVFTGRLDRRTYAISVVALYGALLGAVFAVTLVLGLIADYAGLESGMVDLVFMLAPFVVFYVYRFSLDARRFHDLGYSGFLSLLRLIPLLSIVVLGYLLLKKGGEDPNRYGQTRSLSLMCVFLNREGPSNKSICIGILAAIIVPFVIEITLPSLNLRESEWANNPVKKARDARQEAALGSWLLSAVIGWVPSVTSPAVVLQSASSYDCENGTHFTTEHTPGDNLQISADGQAVRTAQRDSSVPDNLSSYNDGQYAYTFVAGHEGEQLIVTRLNEEKDGSSSTICHFHSDIESVGKIDSQLREKIMSIINKADTDNTLTKKVLNNDYFVAKGSVTDGGQELVGYFKGNQIQKISYSIGLSYGKKDYLYYFDSAKLVYVFEEEDIFPSTNNELNYEKLDFAFGAGYFFSDDKLLLTNSKGKRTYPSANENFIVNAKKYTEMLQ